MPTLGDSNNSQNVFLTSILKAKTINKLLKKVAELRKFFASLSSPSRLADYGIDDSTIELMADKAMIYGDLGNFKKLSGSDVLHIYRMSL
ncbi:iron-containing alcohol dehydrogenase [Paenibacillus sp. NAIST15-1]|nr:iron-containing alcohol dehydrogenase [Paenibacillus sp. NAIST15-1]